MGKLTSNGLITQSIMQSSILKTLALSQKSSPDFASNIK